MIARSLPAHLRHSQELSQIRRRQFMMTGLALAAGSAQKSPADGQTIQAENPGPESACDRCYSGSNSN